MGVVMDIWDTFSSLHRFGGVTAVLALLRLMYYVPPHVATEALARERRELHNTAGEVSRGNISRTRNFPLCVFGSLLAAAGLGRNLRPVICSSRATNETDLQGRPLGFCSRIVNLIPAPPYL